MQENLGREDPLKKGMATHSSTLAWGIPRTEVSSQTTNGFQKIYFHDFKNKFNLD